MHIPVKDNKKFVRDTDTNAIINNDEEARINYRNKLKREIDKKHQEELRSKQINIMKDDVNKLKNDLGELKSDISQIKELLGLILNKNGR